MLAVPSRWHDLHNAELAEVIVKRHRSRDLQPLNDHVADAVREAPLLVSKPLKHLPGLFNVFWLNPPQVGEFFGKQLWTHEQRPIVIVARLEESQCLIHHIVCGDQQFTIFPKKIARRWMELVARRVTCKPGTGVYKNHSGLP